MRISNRNFIASVKDLWVFPEPPSRIFPGHGGVHLRTYRAQAPALEAMGVYNARPVWCDVAPRPIRFSTTPPPKEEAEVKAEVLCTPESSWFVADLSNGAPEDDGGRVWVFGFASRELARKFVADIRSRRDTISVSEPFRMWRRYVD